MTLNEPRWITVAEAEDVARAVVEETGEPFLIRDGGLLESAVMAARNRWHCEGEEDLAELGLGTAVAIERNHPFEQGNKRAAWFSMLAFFACNGLALHNEDDPSLADLFVEVITGAKSPEDLLAAMTVVALD
ncbi:type II toxin-antitoxin system death-on-curing family toxin [Ancylobacter rudongensis]|uniref:Death on curing protein n=1 Tax=Ancylobacter rudongensis TaxID=177413 RepID=A0A1G4R7P2_9HYPH|nr:Fic family protein [Ancylobacter rudongensis]SCW52820.1 death on curing protein [Ancylobacter rudongensis]